MFNTEDRMQNNIILFSYAVYLVVSIILTIWVARTLHKRGAIFLVDAFQGNAELAASVNHLLVVGFYLINIGFVALALKSQAVVQDWRSGVELLSDKMGFVLLVLGAMHFFNLFVFSRIRHRRVPPPPRYYQPPAGTHSTPPTYPPPVAPDAVLKVQVPR